MGLKMQSRGYQYDLLFDRFIAAPQVVWQSLIRSLGERTDTGSGHSASSRISRREFLAVCGKVGALAAAGALIGFPEAVTQAQEMKGNARLEFVPPSLMLHSRDDEYTFLDTLMRRLQYNSYKTTTYQAWEQNILAGTATERPVILSIDDITMARGNRSFPTFRQMHDFYKEAGMVTVFAVITRPDMPQDEALWDEVAGWVSEGFELATHTSYHSNFNAWDTTPRRDFTEADYTIEIVDSAQLIEQKMEERGIDYQVRTLITPFGSGYSHGQPEHSIHPGIITACARTNIKFVVGIVGGKTPVDHTQLGLQNTDVIYLGRTPPAYQTNDEGHEVPLGDHTFGYLEAWHRQVTQARPKALE